MTRDRRPFRERRRSTRGGRKIACSVSIITAALVMSGCTAPGSGSEDSGSPVVEPAIGRVTTPTDPAHVVRPIDEYLPEPEFVLRLARVERARELACLRGADDRQVEWPLDEEEVLAFLQGGRKDRVVRAKLWGFFDPQASRLGYSRSSDVPGAIESGIPAGVAFEEFSTCAQEAADAFPLGNGGGAYSAGYVSSLPDGGPPLPTGDSRVESVVEAWSACMGERGFDYPDPVSAEFDPRWGGGTASVTPEQIATATADMDCKTETNLVGIELAVQSAYDQEYIESHWEALQDMADLIADYIGEVP